MEVKIYREAENQALLIDDAQLNEYNELALELGLITPSQAYKQNIPGVYVPLNFAMQKQLQALCPLVVDVKEYNFSTIPLEVLKVLSLCIKNNMYDGYQIWYNNTEPDPLLIGWNWKSKEDEDNKHSWRKNRFLIARWGAEVLELPVLLQLGKENLEVQLVEKAALAISKAKAVIENPSVYVNQILSNEIPEKIDLNTTASKTIY